MNKPRRPQISVEMPKCICILFQIKLLTGNIKIKRVIQHELHLKNVLKYIVVINLKLLCALLKISCDES